MTKESSAVSLAMPLRIGDFHPYSNHSEDRMVVHLGYMDDGRPFYVNIQDKPHLIIVGNARSGKTTILHDVICSLISTYNQKDLRLVLISNGKSGFFNYVSVPHLYCKVCTEENSILSVLDDVLTEIKRRKRTQIRGLSYCKLVVIFDELKALTIAGKTKALTKIMEIAKEGPEAKVHLVISTDKIGINPIWNMLLTLIKARIVLHVSETDSLKLIGSAEASTTTAIGEGYAVSGEKALLHFQSCKVRVNRCVFQYNENERKRKETESQSYIAKQKAKHDFLSLNPYQFEEYVASRMRECGYTQVTVTSKSGDFGADVLGIDPNGNKVCVQCKQYTSKVGFDAIQQVNTARTLFDCQRAVLVTTSTVTNQARNAAHSLKVELIERFNPSTILR